MAWVKSSTNPIVGNNQTGVGFWKVIMEKFNVIMEQGPMRDVNSVSGKWRKMSKVINHFSGIYNHSYTNPPSGSNEEDILNLALAKWDDKNKTHFQHLRSWKVLKKENKWKPIPNEVATAKRSNTSESESYSAGGSTARCHIDINDEPEFDEEEFAVHESECPPGRDKAKKEAAGKRKASMAGG
ncbi:putative glutathione transferase [Helianthus debilis subsp. tardiflorus]